MPFPLFDDHFKEEEKSSSANIWNHLEMFYNIFGRLGPGRPSAGGPRMDCQEVTSPGVVKISRLASRLRRSARSNCEKCLEMGETQFLLFIGTFCCFSCFLTAFLLFLDPKVSRNGNDAKPLPTRGPNNLLDV